MMPRLRDEDRLAVDLLLDRAATSAGNGNGNGNGHSSFASASGVGPQQLGRVEAVLRVLDMMPADEPPADLVARTVRRVEAESAQHDPAALRPPQPVMAPGMMPHA
jgi:hypothetical protein